MSNFALNSESLSLLENQERVVRAQNEAGLASLADLLRVQSERDRVRTDLANLEDSRRSLLENFKAALGLAPGQADPPTPAHFEISRENPNADELLRVAFAHNPQLAAMEADVRAAEAGIAVAYKERVPDFSAGLVGRCKAVAVALLATGGYEPADLARQNRGGNRAEPGLMNWRRNRD